uniref:SCP2 domain-containing protein n=1 Tax=Rhabditophanes sp. KR3021 TaxID=114890 RepID=A0AC35TP85_9BILA
MDTFEFREEVEELIKGVTGRFHWQEDESLKRIYSAYCFMEDDDTWYFGQNKGIYGILDRHEKEAATLMGGNSHLSAKLKIMSKIFKSDKKVGGKCLDGFAEGILLSGRDV